MKEKYINKLSQMISNVINELSKVQGYGSQYSRTFPEDVKIGLVYFDGDSKKLVASYYSFISSASNSIIKIDSYLSNMSAIMMEADKYSDTACIVLCDEILNQYGEFRKRINVFAEKSEQDIICKNVSASKMLRYFSELSYTLEHFTKYLRTLEI